MGGKLQAAMPGRHRAINGIHDQRPDDHRANDHAYWRAHHHATLRHTAHHPATPRHTAQQKELDGKDILPVKLFLLRGVAWCGRVMRGVAKCGVVMRTPVGMIVGTVIIWPLVVYAIDRSMPTRHSRLELSTHIRAL